MTDRIVRDNPDRKSNLQEWANYNQRSLEKNQQDSKRLQNRVFDFFRPSQNENYSPTETEMDVLTDVKVEIGRRLKTTLWDTKWNNQEKARNIKKLEKIKNHLEQVKQELCNSESLKAKKDLEKINDPKWVEENDKQELKEPDTGGSMPQGKTPGSGTQILHMNYTRTQTGEVSDTQKRHLEFIVEQCANLGVKLVVMTTENAKEDVETEKEKFQNIDVDIVIAQKNVSEWAEDSAEFLKNGKLAVLTKFDSDYIEKGMEKGRQERWEQVEGLPKGEEGKKEILKISNQIHIGAKVNAGDAAENRQNTAKEITGEDAVHIRAYMEGGNLIPGKDKKGQDIVLVGKDSVAATVNAYKIKEEEVRTIIMQDFGLTDKAQVLFVEQPGRFHLDMGLLMIGNGKVIVNDSEESFKEQFSDEDDIPKVPEPIKRLKALEDQAAKDLEEGGIDVIRKGLAKDNKFNFLNGEFVQGANGKEYFITNGGIDEQQEEKVRQYYVNELKIVEDVKFSPRRAAKDSLEEQGGMACRLKGAPNIN